MRVSNTSTGMGLAPLRPLGGARPRFFCFPAGVTEGGDTPTGASSFASGRRVSFSACAAFRITLELRVTKRNWRATSIHNTHTHITSQRENPHRKPSSRISNDSWLPFASEKICLRLPS